MPSINTIQAATLPNFGHYVGIGEVIIFTSTNFCAMPLNSLIYLYIFVYFSLFQILKNLSQ